MGNEFRDRLIQTALRQGVLTPDAVRRAFEIVREQKQPGVAPRLHQILVDHGFLTRDALLDVRRAMAREGLHVKYGEFAILSRLGRGGTGTVYRAHQPSLDRHVAIKVLASHLTADPSYVDRFYREARVAARISHPNIVQVYDLGQTRHTHYIVMEYVAGPTLAAVLRKEGVLEERRARDLGAQLTRALAYMEKRGIVHRDIKPGNVMLTSDGTAKLADLGVAQAPGMASDSSGGTPYYMAPEQARGETEMDVRTDMYALGCTLFHAVVGAPPYMGRNAAETLRLHAEAPLPDPCEFRSNLSQSFCKILRRMMAKRREDRFASAGELLAAWENPRACEAASENAAPATGPAAAIPVAAIPLWVWAVVIALLAVIAVAVYAILRSHSG